MKRGTGDNKDRNEIRVAHTATQRKIPIGRNRCLCQSNLIRNSKNPFPLETACILVLHDLRLIFGTETSILTDGNLRHVGNAYFISSRVVCRPSFHQLTSFRDCSQSKSKRRIEMLYVLTFI